MKKDKNIIVQYYNLCKSNKLSKNDFKKIRWEISNYLQKENRKNRKKNIKYIHSKWNEDEKFIKKNKIILPSLFETVRISLKIEKAIKILEKTFSENNTIVVGGSYARWKFYSIREKPENSDLDLDIIFYNKSKIIKDITNSHNINLIDTFEKYSLNYKEWIVDTMLAKIKINDIEVSFHLIPSKKIDYIFKYDFTQSNEDFILKTFRLQPSSKHKTRYGPTFNFSGNKYYFKFNTYKVRNWYISLQPFLMKWEKREFVLWMGLHQFIVHSLIEGKNSLKIKKKISRIRRQLKIRKEKDSITLKNATFIKLLSRIERMPKHIQNFYKDY